MHSDRSVREQRAREWDRLTFELGAHRPGVQRDLMSIRILNAFDALHVKSIRALTRVSDSDFLQLRNFGRKSLRHLHDTLTRLDLPLPKPRRCPHCGGQLERE